MTHHRSILSRKAVVPKSRYAAMMSAFATVVILVAFTNAGMAGKRSSRFMTNPAMGSQQTEKVPFERTENRRRCEHFDPLKQPWFGETHLHTAYSFDASTIDTRNTPAEAYRYAKGGKVGLPPWADTRVEEEILPREPGFVTDFPYCLPGENCQFTATRTAQLPPGRALDFAAVTDHSEQLGENNICLFEGTEPCENDGNCSLAGQMCSAAGVCVPEGYNDPLCVLARQEVSRLRGGLAPAVFATLENLSENPTRPALCGPEGIRCLENARHVWDAIIRDAEEAYDRTSACTFTSFIAYEYTAMAANGRCSADLLPCWDEAGTGAPSADCAGSQACETDFIGSAGGDNLHRNIIFRNSNVVDLPLSNVDAPLACGQGEACLTRGPVASPELMLRALRNECNPKDNACEFLSIPHNSNLSRGSMFLMPETLDEAAIRHDLEPLVEIMQIKGQSECRFARETGTYWSMFPTAPDELCDFENMSFARLNGNFIPASQQDLAVIPPRSYVRETLKNGLLFERETGINPFKLGFVGGLDNHNGTPGQADETEYAKIGAHAVNSFAVSGQALNEKFFLGLETNGGALTVAWAEENSRDAIFTALKNRETYATSGTRPIVRFFGGFGLPEKMCKRGDFAEQGYANGVPMGGTLKRAAPGATPKFAVSALWDPGWTGQKGTKLQRVQIIKGWIDQYTGELREAVYDVAGKENKAGVNLKKCKAKGKGHKDLCAVWTDPDFDKDEGAFYYARVLENPSCRWNQHYCNARGVNCKKPMGTCRTEHRRDKSSGKGCNSNDDCGSDGICLLPASYTEWEYQQCCSDAVPKTVQQRAWTSPIWYAP